MKSQNVVKLSKQEFAGSKNVYALIIDKGKFISVWCKMFELSLQYILTEIWLFSDITYYGFLFIVISSRDKFNV